MIKDIIDMYKYVKSGESQNWWHLLALIVILGSSIWGIVEVLIYVFGG